MEPNLGWMPYSKLADWKDVVPVFQSDKERSVVNIAYSEKFAEVFAYFRAILQLNEKTERTLQLTKDAAILNPANYTVWQYRREILKHLNKDLHDELKFCRDIIDENPKNYQVWHHRRIIVESMRDPNKELDFTARILRDDAKNYHAWQHRQWVVNEFKLYSDELDYCRRLLTEDIRNNSAWNHRYFIISSTTGYTAEVLDREVKLTLELIRKAPHNESAWNYLTGILEDVGVDSYDGVWDFCAQLYYEDNCKSSYLLAFMVSCLTERLEKSESKKIEIVSEAEKLLSELESIDPIRKQYWLYLRKNFS